MLEEQNCLFSSFRSVRASPYPSPQLAESRPDCYSQLLWKHRRTGVLQTGQGRRTKSQKRDDCPGGEFQ